MTRASFGGGVADFVVAAAAPGDPLRFAAATITFWDAETGGTQLDDLLLAGEPVTSITVGDDGQIPTFQGPDGVVMMWAQAGAGGSRAMVDAAGYIATLAQAAAALAQEAQAAAEDAAAAAAAVGALADAQTAANVSTGPLTGAALAASYSLGTAAVQPFMHKIVRGLGGRLAIVTDSTDNDIVNEWGRFLGDRFAADYPDQSVVITPPADDTYAPGTTVTISTGTGSGVIEIFNMGIAGADTYNAQSADFLTNLVAFNPDAIIVAFGHNSGGITGDPQTLGQPRLAFRLRYQLMLEEWRRRLPYTQFVLVAQHPWSDHPNGDMDQKRDEELLIAQLGGHGFYDMYQEWTDVGSATTAGWYNPGDNVHIGATGEHFYADKIYSIFRNDPKWEPRPIRPSLLDTATSYNLMDDFVMPVGASGPIGWTLDNCTATRVTADPKSGRAYDIQLDPIDATQPSRVYKQVLTSTTVVPWRGKEILFQAYMRRPAAGGVPNRFVGRMSLTDGINSSKNAQDDKGYGGYMARAIPHVVAAASTGVTASLWCDYAPQVGGTPSVIWAGPLLKPGLTPCGWAGRAGISAMRNGETFESVDVGAATMATQSRISLIAAASVQRLLAIFSGANRIWQITTSGTESGGDVGGDLAFQSYNDSGSLLFTILTLNRRFGLAKLRSTTTASRPSASAAGSGLGSMVIDSDLKSLILSDGSVWVPLVGRNTGTLTSGASPNVAAGSDDYYYTITALALAITSINVTGTPKAGQRLHIAITDNGTARAITWGSQFEASTVALPTTTVAGIRTDAQFVWNAVTSKWRCISVA